MTNHSDSTSALERFDRPPNGWFVLDIMPETMAGRRWVALMLDIDPDEIRKPHRECWVTIPGEHRSRDDAWEALEDMMATRH